jgi:Fe-Mn family superoxide dismutase
MAFTQAPLPFDASALEPSGMSAKTFEFHYGKHHAAYINKLNDLVAGTELADKSLEEVIKTSYKEGKTAIMTSSGSA